MTDERKRLGEADMPVVYRTSNEALAHALYTMGFRLSEQVPCIINRYTKAKLDALGFDTAEAAKEAGRRGDVEYVFERTAELDRFVKAWDETQKTIARDGKEARFELPNVTLEEAATIACQLSKNRPEFRSLWKLVPARTNIEKVGRAKTRKLADGKLRVSNPGFVEYTDNLNPEAKRKLGVR